MSIGTFVPAETIRCQKATHSLFQTNAVQTRQTVTASKIVGGLISKNTIAAIRFHRATPNACFPLQNIIDTLLMTLFIKTLRQINIRSQQDQAA